jgi:hypothetical protein
MLPRAANFRSVGRPSNEVRRFHANFTYQAGSWTKPPPRSPLNAQTISLGAPALPVIESDKIAGMADYTHTIDRWDDATGENLIEQIASVGGLSGRAGDPPRGGEALARRQDHAAQPGAGDRRQQDESCKKLRGLSIGRCGTLPALPPDGPPGKVVTLARRKM